MHLFFLNPQSLRDSPGGARGKDSPKPLRSLRASHGLFNPQSLRDSPGGARGKDSPNPFGRFAPSVGYIMDLIELLFFN